MYAAPEVYSRQPTGLPSDVWGLGCVLHELCALRPAFQAGTIRALRAKASAIRGGVLAPHAVPAALCRASRLRS